MSTSQATEVLRLDAATCALGEGARRVTALDEVSLSLRQRELLAVMGPSGSGKSTLLNVMGLLLPPTSGTLTIHGEDASHLSRAEAARLRRTTLGFVFQHYNMLPSLTLAENVSIPLELDGSSPRSARAEADTALAEVGLEGLGERYPDEVSGGQVQRAAIARALVGPRSILLADEPTGALDTSTSDDVLRILRARVDDGAAGVLVTHEPRFAAWADRVIRMRDGHVFVEDDI